jgi:branched-chain amino acid transport system ATP-binding protein
MSDRLSLQDVSAGYGNLVVLRELSLRVGDGEVVALLGANGAGKSTTLRAIAGLIPHEGTIAVGGAPLRRHTPERLVRRGVALVPEGRGTFPNLTVVENLVIGGRTRSRSATAEAMDRWFHFFPRLAERRAQLAGTLSGGEQQMLAVARALMSGPSVLLLDEPSMGLAPNITETLFDRLAEIARSEAVSMLVVEQNAQLALGLASRGYVIEDGQLAFSGDSTDLRDDPRVRHAYLRA